MQSAPVGGSGLDSALRRLEDVSWDFDGVKSRSPMSAMHFHPALLISQIPGILITRLSGPGDLVLDPFCGSGTTLTEAQRLGRRSIGLDINPVSVLVSRVKTLDFAPDTVVETLSALRFAAANPSRSNRIPDGVQTAKWYEPRVAAGLAAMLADINETEDADRRDLKKLAFSSLLLKVCRETRHWGYVCDNTTPRDEPGRNLTAAIDEAIENISSAFRAHGRPEAPAEVFEAPAHSVAELVEAESVDLVVTSPPYEGVVDYVKAQRLTLEWFGYDLETHRKRETGARSKRHRRTAAKEFGEDLRRSFEAVGRTLRPNGFCAVVFGVSPSRSFTFADFVATLEATGLELRGEYVRQVALRRRLMPSILSERLFVFAKPKV